MAVTSLPPPYPDYAYFEGHDLFPFDFQATAFNLSNAWWLAEASTLVYAEPTVVRTCFDKVGLKDVGFFEAASTHCIVAANNRFAFVGFRGSEVSEQKGKIDVIALSTIGT